MHALNDKDAVALTLTFAASFGLLIVAESGWLLAAVFALALITAMFLRVNATLIGITLLAPLLPILVSHVGIEPFFAKEPITLRVFEAALFTWLRLGSMALLSIAWIASLDTTGAAQLCRIVVLGQFLLIPFLIASTFLRTTRDRWFAIRELRALRQRGLLRKRTKLPMAEIPAIGLQLTMSSLISSSEIALACQGRGIGSRRLLAVQSPKLSMRGAALIAVAGLTTVLAVKVLL